MAAARAGPAVAAAHTDASDDSDEALYAALTAHIETAVANGAMPEATGNAIKRVLVH